MFTTIPRDRHNFETATTGPRASLEEMNKMSPVQSHRHTEVTTYVLRQKAGVPFEVERKVCSSCRQVLTEKPLRRAAA